MSRSLPAVTLCCVDTTDRFARAVDAVRRSMAELRFGDVFIASTSAHLATLRPEDGIRGVRIRPLTSTAAYSRFVVQELAAHVRTPHALLVQWDGFVIHPRSWSDEFLAFDYVGAPWRHVDGPFRVGNGGFSLRSKRLMDAVAARAVVNVHPEDAFICRSLRPELERIGLRFAPEPVAARFAIENGSLAGRPFGFHGLAHFPHVLGASDTEACLRSLLPARQLLTEPGRQWLRGLAAAIDDRIRTEPRFETTRAVLGSVLRAAMREQAELGQPPERLQQWCRDLVRAGYLSLARELSAQWPRELPRSAPGVQAYAKAAQRRWRSLPVD